MFWILFSLVVALLMSAGCYRALREAQGLRGLRALGIFATGAFVALPTRLVVAYVLDSLGWSLRVTTNRSVALEALGAAAVVVVVEQLVLAILVWPAYRGHRLERVGTALSVAGMGACGFGSAYAVLEASAAPGATAAFLGIGAFISRLFVVGLWASCLATTLARYKPWIATVWCLSVVVDGFMRHLLSGRGIGWQVVSLPPLFCMIACVFWVTRRLSRVRLSLSSVGAAGPGPGEHHRLEDMRAAFQHAHRPALVHWIFGGALVSFGASLVGLALGVLAAHALGIDLSRVDETNASAAIPLLVLGLAVLLSFPVSGFLTAKAAAADSLFEPGMSALLSIVALTVLLSRSAPVTLVLGLSLAPLAFSLACLGAWFGLASRSRPNR